MLKDPGYEYTDLNCLVEEHATTLYFISDLSRYAAGEMKWLDGWDEDAFNASVEAICVMSAGTAEASACGLGSGIFACLSAGKHVLTQLQEKD